MGELEQPAEGLNVFVTGVVQGVGFRPYVYRLARALNLRGSVWNAPEGVSIHLEGCPDTIARFLRRLPLEIPPGARIEGIRTFPDQNRGCVDFAIVKPGSQAFCTDGRARIPADQVMCEDCLRDLETVGNRRWHYPFTTCTTCGPRYSILEIMPFDRQRTSMRGFSLCPDCQREYADPTDRRCHAQTIACPACGPVVQLEDATGQPLAAAEEAIPTAVRHLKNGDIVALQGLGGFQLLARADQAAVVQKLRQRKDRLSKPFAIMVRDLATAERLVELSGAARMALTRPENPIVLLPKRRDADRLLAPEIAPRLRQLGVFLPTTPLHHLLLRQLDFPLVATSGNRGAEPIVIDTAAARQQLKDLADVFLVHDRPILHRIDDSVVRLIDERPVALRLARGYAPLPLPALERGTGPALLAVGGQQKVAVALRSATQAVLGPHVGDLNTSDSRHAFKKMIRGLRHLYDFQYEVIACDLHPDYFTTQFAQQSGQRVIQVQHHHAHAVSCLVEHDLLDRTVLAFTWDGTGYGTDGTIWGGELLRVTNESFDRLASLAPFALPGAEAAIYQPSRIALGLLAQYRGAAAVLQDDDLLKRLRLSANVAQALLKMLEKDVNSIRTTSMGRLFDAVAALVLGVDRVSYEGEAAAWLEAVADPEPHEPYPLVTLDKRDGSMQLATAALLATLARDVRDGVAHYAIAGRFHQTLAAWAAQLAARFPTTDVVLSGGCFQNALLTSRTRAALEAVGKRVYTHEKIPPNDGGLAVGQLAVAVAQL